MDPENRRVGEEGAREKEENRICACTYLHLIAKCFGANIEGRPEEYWSDCTYFVSLW